MQWDLGWEGAALLAVIAVGFGALAGLLAGGGASRRIVATVVTAVACFGVGLLTSEWLFGWATEEDLQPNVDGLSRDEVLLSSLITTTLVVLVLRYVVRRAHRASRPRPARHPHGRHVRHA
jgi:ribose/xylose/arabinose/galactoside ABC-type transport system permease subunit